MRVKSYDDAAVMLTILQIADPSLLAAANAFAKEVTGSSSSGMRERLMNAKATIFCILCCCILGLFFCFYNPSSIMRMIFSYVTGDLPAPGPAAKCICSQLGT
jgi:hypothetical protein